jgi:hypothetical protein
MRRRITKCSEAAWIAVFVLVAGCSNSIRFVADTLVDEGGNVVRRTEIASSGDASWDALSTRYDLPPGGSWTETVEEPAPAGPNETPQRVYDRRYMLTRRFGRGDAIAGDFRRLGRRPDRAATNAVNVRARRYWFVDTYEYEETFHDIATRESLKAALRGFYAEIVSRFADGISGLDDDVSPQLARERLNERFDARVEALLSVFDSDCFTNSSKTGKECLEALAGNPAIDFFVELDDEDTLISEVAALFPAPGSISDDDWRSMLSGVYDDVDERLDDFVDTEQGGAIEDDIFGAHGWALFESYPFELSVQLPGEIVATNADTQEAGTLRWEFAYDDFWLTDLVLRAESRIVHRDRIVIAAALALLGAIAGLLVVVTRRRSAAGD